MVVSRNDATGRIRIRSDRLKCPRTSESLRGVVAEMNGVAAARVNSPAGSLIVHFDSTKVDAVALEDELERLCTATQMQIVQPHRVAESPKRSSASKQLNRVTKVGMVTTLGASLVAAYTRSRKAHIVFGSAFVALAVLHMAKYPKTLLR